MLKIYTKMTDYSKNDILTIIEKIETKNKMTKNRKLKIIQKLLGIDWKIDRMKQTIDILEKKNYQYDANAMCNNIKDEINRILKNSKRNIHPSREEMITIRSNLNKCDHSDMVKIDQILTREQNQHETDYQWGSLVMNAKWKII